MDILRFSEFINEKLTQQHFATIAKRRGMSDDCIKLVSWWGLTGYLYYNAMTHKTPSITTTGRKMLNTIYSSLLDGSYDDYESYSDWYDDPEWCVENLWKEMGKNFIDDTFSENETSSSKPLRVFKNYDKVRFTPGKPNWYSFSFTKDGYQGAFGDDYIGYELPAGFKYLDTYGLADRGEVIINSLHLTDEMVIQRGYSQTSN